MVSSWQVIKLFYLTHNYQEKYLLISMPQIFEPKSLDILFFLLKRRQSSASVSATLSRLQLFQKACNNIHEANIYHTHTKLLVFALLEPAR